MSSTPKIPRQTSPMSSDDSALGSLLRPVEQQHSRNDTKSTIYFPLNRDGREIRLAHILPTEARDVEVRLETVSLDNDPIYDALSYCWGDPKIASIIKVNGQAEEARFNLVAALKQFRRQAKGEEVVLWADALCVNQKDKIERGHQVTIMPDIYRSAQRVRAWLGDSKDEVVDAFRRLVDKAMDRPYGYKDIGSEKTRCSHESVLQELNSILYPEESLIEFTRSLSVLEQNPYWTRKWIILEATLARKFRLHMGNIWVELCDEHCEDRWYKPSTFISELCDALDPTKEIAFPSAGKPPPASQIEAFSIFRDLHRKISCITMACIRVLSAKEREGSPYDGGLVMSLIMNSRETKCLDPRDCVFAGQILLPKSMSIDPDYDASVPETFTQFTLRITRTMHSLQVLEYAHSDREDLPSWVPDFTCPAPSEILGSAHASVVRFVSYEFRQPAPDKLSVPAMTIAKVLLVPTIPDWILDLRSVADRSSALEAYNIWNTAFRSVQKTLAAKNGVQPIQKELADFDMFWDTLDEGYHVLDPLRGDFSPLRRGLRLMQEGSDEGANDQATVVRIINETARDSVFFFISFGLAAAMRKYNSNTIREGDLLMIIATATMPFCVRAAPDAGHHAYRLLNTCYISGVMHGEIVRRAAQLSSGSEDNLGKVFKEVILV